MTPATKYDPEASDKGIRRGEGGTAATPPYATLVTPVSYGDCVSCDGYVLSAEDAPHCPTCARLTREGTEK